MKDDLKQAWVAGLRSGKYKQTNGTLTRVDFMRQEADCCLGVLCKVILEQFPEIPLSIDSNSEADFAGRKRAYMWASSDAMGGTLSPEMLDYIDMSGAFQAWLTEQNDSVGANFDEIAAAVEAYNPDDEPPSHPIPVVRKRVPHADMGATWDEFAANAYWRGSYHSQFHTICDGLASASYGHSSKYETHGCLDPRELAKGIISDVSERRWLV